MNHKKELEVKSNWSYLYQKFLKIDPRMRKNIVIGASMILMVVVTGFLLAAIALVKIGGSFIESKVADYKAQSIKNNSVENI